MNPATELLAFLGRLTALVFGLFGVVLGGLFGVVVAVGVVVVWYYRIKRRIAP